MRSRLSIVSSGQGRRKAAGNYPWQPVGRQEEGRKREEERNENGIRVGVITMMNPLTFMRDWRISFHSRHTGATRPLQPTSLSVGVVPLTHPPPLPRRLMHLDIRLGDANTCRTQDPAAYQAKHPRSEFSLPSTPPIPCVLQPEMGAGTSTARPAVDNVGIGGLQTTVSLINMYIHYITSLSCPFCDPSEYPFRPPICALLPPSVR
jgi:hypothetical protein